MTSFLLFIISDTSAFHYSERGQDIVPPLAAACGSVVAESYISGLLYPSEICRSDQTEMWESW
jgi:hypothetical protein